jgi:ligand-binding SRPBCC domain-containing protein
MNTYEKVSLLECQVEDLFNFHLDTNNLKVISPQGIKVTLLNEDFVPKEGAILKLKTVKNFISMIWEVKIATLQAPNLLVDVALKSPFKLWKHSHIFTQINENTCELKDLVEYSLPFRLDFLLNFFVQHELEKMFAFRHSVTKQLLEERK